jgi:hypothetical protein
MDQAQIQTKKFYKKWWFWTIIVVVLLIIGANGNKPTPKQSVPAPGTNSQSSSTAPVAQTASQSIPQTLLDLKGSGTKTTQKFTAASDWDLEWSYDCSNFGSQGNFMVYVYNGDGSISYSNAGVNQLGKSDSGVENYHSGGTFYLTVNSVCKWKIMVKG